MQIRYFLALSLLPPLTLAETLPQEGGNNAQCVILPPVPYQQDGESSGPLADQKIQIHSDASSAQLGREATFEGNVTFSQAGRKISAERATVNQQEQQLTAQGNLVFQDPLFTVTADSLMAQMRSNNATLEALSTGSTASKFTVTPRNWKLPRTTTWY